MSLHLAMAEGAAALEPLTEAHREGLRAACGADMAIWEIYPADWGPAAFDRSFDMLIAHPARLPFAILHDGAVAGMTAYIAPDPARGVVEIGNSYIAPRFRGGGLNAAVKRLMIGRAFADGWRRIEFRVDKRNARSQAAVLKLGVAREGVLRAERITWNGHVRDTVVFGLLAGEWRA